jgi:hypothetical protein
MDHNASCIILSEPRTNPDRLRHVDVNVISYVIWFLCDLVRDGHARLLKCAYSKMCTTL